MAGGLLPKQHAHLRTGPVNLSQQDSQLWPNSIEDTNLLVEYMDPFK